MVLSFSLEDDDDVNDDDDDPARRQDVTNLEDRGQG